ncbi:MAG: 2-oxo-4-hydroxy-4-carboxy-5-ureidoimidazoline decarboxylase [SAR324 cluster bacterium]|nr:2-oxo-4-hydroxy-4-carboxy-5-ureidoimidazoline decarboxylase [SAR324 cluster bacterium]
MNLAELNQGDSEQARIELLKCCGSSKWVNNILAARPFSSVDQLHVQAEKIWLELGKDDYLEAFAAHPKIGESKVPEKAKNTENWTRKEQAGMLNAADPVKLELEKQNRKYEKKFGYIFIVCATGKSAEEMLDLLQQRLENIPMIEINIAAWEQNKITKLRLNNMLADV